MAAESGFVFNVVWAGTVFDYLRPFVESLLAHTDARFRFVANACPDREIERMVRFASGHDSVIEVLNVSDDEMVPHGEALERVLAIRDDGEYFCFVDSDIRAIGPFVADFSAVFDEGAAGVTSGRGVWSRTDVVPEGHAGVNGEYFYDPGGFLFGSPHFAMYRRSVIDEVRGRWDIGFGSGGPGLSDRATARLAEAGLEYWVYDTGKLVNAFLQFDGHELRHQEHPNLMHIGGMSHYLSPPDRATPEGLAANPRWATWDPDRLEVAEFCAAVLVAKVGGEEPPAVPLDLEPERAERLERVRGEILELVERFPA